MKNKCQYEQVDELEEYEDDIYDDVPFGCRACGGLYPNCVDSCSLYDD